ncbi:hypothetical protein C8R44DRAFT_749658 [Mycena epipterygia]|nr:hypothetical protein C8R44DRAFT_749658 [Mycena epipterygia]
MIQFQKLLLLCSNRIGMEYEPLALENPRIGDPVGKPKTVTVDTQIYLDGSTPALVGCLRWYNKDDFKFPESEIGGFQLWIQLAYLGPASEIDMCHRAIVHVLGMASHTSTDDATFEVHAEQWISALGGPGVAPFKFLIPDNGRYKGKKKPVPSENSRVLVTGRIMDVECHRESDGAAGAVAQFFADMETVVFLGSNQKGTGTPAHKAPVKTEGTPAQLKFSFTKPHQTPTPSANRKRKECDESADDDKGGSSKKFGEK